MCVVPSIGSVLIGKILAKLRGAKLWVHVQDFEFDAATDSNLVGNKNIIFRTLFWIERKLLGSANFVSTISVSMIRKLVNKVPNIDNKLLSNWVDANFIQPNNYSTHKYLTSSKFKILYSGNIGEKQDWDLFIKFAKELEQLENIEIVVVGNGSKRIWLEESLLDLENIRFYSPVPYNELSNLLCSADLHVLFQKVDVIDTVMPSKILAMMSSSKTSLITGNMQSEVSSIIKKSKSGMYFDSQDCKPLVDFVLKLKSNKQLQKEFGESARAYVTENYSKSQILEEFRLEALKLIES